MGNTLKPFRIVNNRIQSCSASLKHRSAQYESYGSNAISNVRFQAASSDALTIRWTINAPLGALTVWAVVYLDGEYAGKTQGESITVGGISTGRHSILLRLEPDSRAGLWDFFDIESGSRPLIDWSASSATQDIASYILYWDNATGTVSFTTALATVDTIETTHKDNSAPDSGTGTGTLSSHGDYDGGYPYCQYQVVIDTAGSMEDYGDGATYKWRKVYWDNEAGGLVTTDYDTLNPIYAADQYEYLDDGISISFDDATDSYVADDTWNITFACRQYYRHPAQLSDGTYKVCIRSSDGVNTSINIDPQVTFTVDAPPADPSGVAIAYQDESKIEITGTAPDVADISKIVICSNCGVDADEPDKRFLHSDWYSMGFLQYQPSSEITVTAGEAFTYTSGVLTEGIWKFSVMAMDAKGKFSDGIDVYKMELRGTIPEEVTLSPAPTGLDAVQVAGGSIRLDFSLYGLSNTTGRAASANVYYDNNTGTVDYTTAIATATNTHKGIWTKCTATVTGLTDATEYIFGVRAVSETGDEESNTDTVTCKADATAPNPPGSVTVTLEV